MDATLDAKAINLFSSNSNVTHFQFTNIANMSLEVLDLDFDEHTLK